MAEERLPDHFSAVEAVPSRSEHPWQAEAEGSLRGEINRESY